MFTKDTLQSYIEKGLISVQTHPKSDDVCIYNYTQSCQYSGAWDDITIRCRGLIIDWRDTPDGAVGKMLSNPLPKFFNWEEHVQKGKPVPAEKPIVYEKLDGWLGILYWLDGEPYIATRGSFMSTGAQWATEWFRRHVDWENITDREWTHLFEIISPGTKIVCNYEWEGLVQLTARHLKNGMDTAIDPRCEAPTLFFKEKPENYGCNCDKVRHLKERVETHDYDALRALEGPNEEGFVIAFPNGLRLKIKFEEYKRLHKIITGVSAIGIWEMLRDGRPINFENVPDEFFKWVTDTAQSLIDKFNEIKQEAREQFATIEDFADHTAGFNRKWWAIAVQKNMTHPSIGFSILDEKEYDHIIWKMIRPKGQSVFKKDD